MKTNDVGKAVTEIMDAITLAEDSLLLHKLQDTFEWRDGKHPGEQVLTMMLGRLRESLKLLGTGLSDDRIDRTLIPDHIMEAMNHEAKGHRFVDRMLSED